MTRHLMLAAALFPVSALLAAAPPPAKPPASASTVQVISPPDRAVLPVGDCHIIVRQAPSGSGKTGALRLVVDGKEQAWEPFRPPLYVARVRLSAGRHRIDVGGRRLQVAAAPENGNAPAGWERHHAHAIDSERRCASCHETQSADGLLAVGALRTGACRDCHAAVDLDAAHSHPMGPLAHCQQCHALHGSPRPALLKAPVKTLCAACHDS